MRTVLEWMDLQTHHLGALTKRLDYCRAEVEYVCVVLGVTQAGIYKRLK